MRIFKLISCSIFFSVALANFAWADAAPITCPLSKDIQKSPPQEGAGHSLRIKCMSDSCFGEQTSRFGTDFRWHLYLHPKNGAAKEDISLNAQMLDVINSLVYSSGPIEEQTYAYVCRYNNSMGYDALAVYTKEVKCPSADSLVQQKENGKTSCWLGFCSYTLEDHFDSDISWNFSIKLTAWSESDAKTRVYNILPKLLYGKGSNNAADKIANPIKENNNLYVCHYYTADGYAARATSISYD